MTKGRKQVIEIGPRETDPDVGPMSQAEMGPFESL